VKTETLSAALPEAVEDLAVRVLEVACDQKLTIATAESCTGGLISSLLTDVEGSSHAFECGLATYSDAAKIDLLGVSHDLINTRGAVSAEVALAMVEGALKVSRADVAIAVTGFAGPAGPGDEPGLVYFACKRRGAFSQMREEHFGNVGRGQVRIAATKIALQMLLEATIERLPREKAPGHSPV